MDQLLHDQLAPITSEFGFVEADSQTIADWYRVWDSSNVAARGVQVRRQVVAGSLAEMLQSLLPLTSVEARRYLFIPTRGSWTAYFDNGWQGSDAARLDYVASQLQCRAVRVVAVPDTLGTKADRFKKGRYGATIFELYGPRSTTFLNHERSIAVANDGGRWIFQQAGTPLPFEQLEAYGARSIRDRFNIELLDRYLQALGIHAFDEAFYKHEGVLLERVGPLAANVQEYSLDEVRQEFGARPLQS
jgi:hypothetical protein